MPILPDLLLAEILETWELSESSLKKSVKKEFFIRNWFKIVFFDSG